jgi:hypothetical protein
MGIAFSGGPRIVAVIDGSSSAGLRAGLHDAVTEVGWAFDAVGGGYKYRMVSRQGFAAKCLIRDIGFAYGGKSAITIQFLSDDEERLGCEHPLFFIAGRSYEIFACNCQMFVAAIGYSSDSPEGLGGQYGHFVCGGVPYTPQTGPPCQGEPGPEIPVTEAWWSSGAGLSIFGPQGFRLDFRNLGAEWDGCWNGNRMGGTKWPLSNRLQLAAVAHSGADYTWATMPQTEWVDGEPLYFDPLLIWGGMVRGQVWNAMLGSKHAPLDDVVVTEEFDPESAESYGVISWRNWMHHKGDLSGGKGTYYASLYLRLGTTPEDEIVPIRSNYAY